MTGRAQTTMKFDHLSAFSHALQKTYWGYGAELMDPDGYRIRLRDERSMHAPPGRPLPPRARQDVQRLGQRPEADKHLTIAAAMYREIGTRTGLEQSEAAMEAGGVDAYTAARRTAGRTAA